MTRHDDVRRIEDYALLGDRYSAALVGRDGSIDWLCWPRFDADACFAALLGTPEHGRWLIAPQGEIARTERRYRDHTLVLETDLETAEGAVRLIDFMPTADGSEATRLQSLVRRVQGLRGRVPMRLELILRFDFGLTVPWMMRTADDEWTATAGPHRVVLRTPVPLEPKDMHSVAAFEIAEGETLDFVMSHGASYRAVPPRVDAQAALDATEGEWTAWSGQCAGVGRWSDAVTRSLSVLRALTYRSTGGIIAAPTTSLPEKLGGERNWDYRFCWLRDATLTLVALMNAGYYEEAKEWRAWLLRAVAGAPSQLQIMYGIAGERLLPEREIDWLPGFAGSKPVRVGNAAHQQRQLDVYGELAHAMTLAAEHIGPPKEAYALSLRRGILGDLEKLWREPDDGIWEIRGEPQHFVHSKAMAWVAFTRAAESTAFADAAEHSARWRAIADEIHAEVCEKGWDAEQNSFVQAYGSRAVDASLLLLCEYGFLPADDPRMIGTVAAIEQRLLHQGLVLRYETESGVDGLPAGEGCFIACSFWLVDQYVRMGRLDEAEALFEHLLKLRNDLGLLAEEYDPEAGCQLGNFPQAFSHLALVNSAFKLYRARHPDAAAPQRTVDRADRTRPAPPAP